MYIQYTVCKFANNVHILIDFDLMDDFMIWPYLSAPTITASLPFLQVMYADKIHNIYNIAVHL